MKWITGQTDFFRRLLVVPVFLIFPLFLILQGLSIFQNMIVFRGLPTIPVKGGEAETSGDPSRMSLSPSSGGVIRTWTDASGRHHVRAELIDSDARHVILKKSDGRLIGVPLNRLCAADRKLVR
ncbi:MAG: SHD1 domain-containing protein, partial [Planctomycetia bacterium]|nr:SHD1 domain-containing protein [Planctomycetia bacterium]